MSDPRAVSPDEAPIPVQGSRASFFEGGWCVHHDEPTEVTGGREWCRRCEDDFTQALAVMDGARDRRRP